MELSVLTERRQKLIETLRAEKERKGQLEEALKQCQVNEQQLTGAVAILEQLEREAVQAPAPDEPPAVKKNEDA